ncbi:hypothetical protein RCH33_566 [Flavobacterium daejeonense]|nr:hypothetical protein RCH33_566 [Flavobacterium daejeonense]
MFLFFMVEVKYKYGFFLFFFFFGIDVLLADNPPSPSAPGIPPPVGLPIDNGVLFMLLGAVIFGFYKIYCSIDKKKRPV